MEKQLIERISNWNPYYVIQNLPFYLTNLNIEKNEVINNELFNNTIKNLPDLGYKTLYDYLPKYIKENIYDWKAFSKKFVSEQTYMDLINLKCKYEKEINKKYEVIEHDILKYSIDAHEFLWKIIKEDTFLLLYGSEKFKIKFINYSIISTNIENFEEKYNGNYYKSIYNKMNKKWQFYISFNDEQKYLIVDCDDAIV